MPSACLCNVALTTAMGCFSACQTVCYTAASSPFQHEMLESRTLRIAWNCLTDFLHWFHRKNNSGLTPDSRAIEIGSNAQFIGRKVNAHILIIYIVKSNQTMYIISMLIAQFLNILRSLSA